MGIETLAGDATAAELHDEAMHGTSTAAGKLTRDEDGTIRMAFGDPRGLPAREHLSFLDWMLRKDFAPATKAVARAVLVEASGGRGADANDAAGG